MEDPYHHFIPSIAPSSLLLIRNSNKDFFKDQFIVPGLVSRSLVVLSSERTVFDSKENCECRFMDSLNERIRDIKLGPDQNIYLSTDSGKLLRLVRKQ